MFKKLIIFLAIMAIMPAGYAIPSEGTSGLMPSSPLWRIDRLAEDIQLRLTTNPEKRVELKMRYAEERLGEAYYMGLWGNEKAVEKTLGAYAREVSSAQDNTLKIDNDMERLRVRHKVKNDITSQKRSIEQIESLINRLSMPEESKKGLLNALDSVSKSSDDAIKDLESDIEDDKNQVREKSGNGDVEEIEDLAQGIISPNRLNNMVADWNAMNLPNTLKGKFDGCYVVKITRGGAIAQIINGQVTNDKISIAAQNDESLCMVQEIHSEDVMNILDAIEEGDVEDLLKIGKRYGYGITDIVGMARQRGIEISANDLIRN